MQQSDPSQFAGVIGNAKAQLAHNPQAISALQEATDNYKSMREDGIAQELMDSKGFNELSYEDKVRKAVKAGIPMSKAVAMVNDINRGKIEQQKIVSPTRRMREDYNLDISILQQQLKNPLTTPEERVEINKEIKDRRAQFDLATQRYNQLKALNPKTAEQMVSEVGYNDLGQEDPNAFAEILNQYTEQPDQPAQQAEQPQQPEDQEVGGVDTGESGAPQAKEPEESSLNVENVITGLTAAGLGYKGLKSKRGIAAIKHLVKTLKSFNPKFNAVTPKKAAAPQTATQRVKAEAKALKEAAFRKDRANRVAASAEAIKPKPSTPAPVSGRSVRPLTSGSGGGGGGVRLGPLGRLGNIMKRET
jgi:hypothetical protein